MAKKPTCKELEQRVRELEKEAVDRMRLEDALKERKTFLSDIFSSIQDGMSVMEPGDILEIWGDCPTFETDLRTWCERLGRVLLSVEDGGDNKKIIQLQFESGHTETRSTGTEISCGQWA
jgi:TusA-related sulfurtransferase